MARQRVLCGVNGIRSLQIYRRFGQAQLVHLERSPLGIGLLAQKFVSVTRFLVKGVLLVVGVNACHLTGGDKASHVVNVSVGFVGVNAVGQPQHLGAAKVFAKHLLDLLLIHVGISSGGEQAHFGGQHRALAVHVDRTAL